MIIGNTIKIILFGIIFCLSFCILLSVYLFITHDLDSIKMIYKIFKYASINPLMSNSETLNHLYSYLLGLNLSYFWFLGITFLSGFIAFAVCLSKVKNANDPNTEKVTRGPKLIKGKTLNKEFKRLAKTEVKEIINDLPFLKRFKISRRKMLRGLLSNKFLCSSEESKVKIPPFILNRHIAFIGSTGVGKSTQIKHLIEYANAQNEKSIILDINGEIYSEMGRDCDIILSPFDKRSHRWDFSKELSNGELINSHEYAKYIVPKGNEQNSFWWKGARTVFSELLDKYKNSEALWNAITDQSRDFRNHLSGVVSNIIGKTGSSQDSGILGTLSSDLSFLRHIISFNEFSNTDYFSISSWSQNHDSSNVYIIFSDKDFESIVPLVRIWLNLAILGRFSAGDDNNLPILNLIADELGDLGRLEKLPSALTRFRKYRGRVVLGFQSEGQLYDLYGRDEVKTMKGNIGTRFIFRTPEEDEARNLSKFLGRSEVISVSKNTSVDKKGVKHSSNTSSTSYKDIVLDSEIRALADGHFYLKTLNLSPTKARIRKKKWIKIRDLHKEMTFKSDKRSKESKTTRSDEESNTQSHTDILSTQTISDGYEFTL